MLAAVAHSGRRKEAAGTGSWPRGLPRAIGIPDPKSGRSSVRFERRAKLAERCRFPASSFVVPMRRQMGPAQTRRQTMRVMVFAKATEDSEKGAPPTPERVRGDGPVHRGAGQGRRLRGRRRPQEQRPGQAHRLSKVRAARSSTGRSPRPASWSPASQFGRSRTWTRRWPGRSARPIPCRAESEIEIRPFYEAAESGRVHDARGALGAP